MGLKECNIQLYSSWGGYYPGQLVSGNVICTFDSPKTLQGIYINIKGRSETSWRESKTRQMNDNISVVHSASEEYFNVTFNIFGNNNGDEIEVPAGTHAYPFQYTLPPELPSSFEGEHGFIRYTLKAILSRPWKFDHEAKMAFTIISDMDLNTNVDVIKPLRIEMTKSFCCWRCESGPLTVDVEVPRSGYCSGETIPLEINVENSSNVYINRIVVELTKIVTYHSRLPTIATKQSVATIAKVNSGVIQSYSTKCYKECLQVPTSPPSNLLNCGIIDLDYEIKVICVISGFNPNIYKSAKLFVGTVPFGFKQQQDSIGYPSVKPEMSDNVSADTPLLVSTAFKSQNTFPSESTTSSHRPYSPPPPYSPSPYHGPRFNFTPNAPHMENETDTQTIVPSVNTTCPYPIAQPLFQRSQFFATTIHDSSDNQHTRILSQFAPFYPTYGFVTNNM